MGIGIIDYITLAKAGYKKAEIDEIIAHSKEEEAVKPEEQLGANTVDNPVSSPEAEKPTEKVEETTKSKEDEINYKELYEKSQEDLKKAQAANRAGDNSGNRSEDPEKDLRALIGSYL